MTHKESFNPTSTFQPQKTSEITTYFQWKEWGEFPVLSETGREIPNKFEKRLVIPWGDPKLFEYPFDYVFGSIEEAIQGLHDFDAYEEAIENGWVLVELTEKIMGKLVKQ